MAFKIALFGNSVDIASIPCVGYECYTIGVPGCIYNIVVNDTVRDSGTNPVVMRVK